MKKACDTALIALFLTTIGLPLAGTIFGWNAAGRQAEKRELAPFPALRADWNTLTAFPRGLDAYFQDNFGFRPLLVRWHSFLNMRMLGVAPSTTVMNGSEGWLFYADDGAVEDYVSDKPFDAEELEYWRDTLQQTDNWLRSRGIDYVFAIAPDKHAVYPERMPRWIHKLGDSRTDQLIAYMRAHSTVTVLDLRAALVEAKQRERVYSKTDTHWNPRGALVAYQAILRNAGIQPWPRSEFQPTSTLAPGLDLADMVGLSDIIKETVLGLKPLRPRAARIIEPADADPAGEEALLITEIPNADLPRAVVFRDSFSSSLIPFISEHFSRTVYLWQNDFDPEVVEKENPDLVIHEIAGRRLTNHVPYNPLQNAPSTATHLRQP